MFPYFMFMNPYMNQQYPKQRIRLPIPQLKECINKNNSKTAYVYVILENEQEFLAAVTKATNSVVAGLRWDPMTCNWYKFEEQNVNIYDILPIGMPLRGI